MHDLYSAVWANKILEKILPHLPKQTYLVGGCVRDLILGAPLFDFDLVTFGPPMELALQIGAILRGKAFFIDHERQVARVAMNHGELTLDISPPRGQDIEADLTERDITINAMAINPADGSLIDPLGGMQDLLGRRIRLIAEKNLKDDPLRGLRCLRFSVQLQCTIETSTMELLKHHAGMLDRVAPERIKHEFLKALSCPCSFVFFRLLNDAGYTTVLFGVSLDDDNFMQACTIASEVESLLCTVQTTLPGIESYFDQSLEHGLTRAAALRLLAFFIGMSVRSQSHEDEMRLVRTWCKRLALSSKTCQVISKAVSGYQAVIGLADKPELLGSDKHRVLSAHAGSIPEMLIAVLAAHGDTATLRNTEGEDESMRVRIVTLWDYYLKTFKPHEESPLVTGDDIMEAFSLSPGPLIGQMLRRVGQARADGLVTTPQQALEYLSRDT